MAVCPKCSFALVLLPKRRRYKCAKCSGLYPENLIDSREFRRWNKKQREITKEEIERDFKRIWNAYKILTPFPRQQRQKPSEEERKSKRKEYYQKNREKILKQNRKWAQKNEHKISERRRRYYQKNEDKLKQRSREWHYDNRDYANKYKSEYYYKNKKYLDYKRKRRYELKKALALQANKNDDYSPCKGKSLSQMAENYLFNYCGLFCQGHPGHDKLEELKFP